MMAAATPAATGTAGLFVPVQGRLMDTRNGIGGYSTPMSANSWRTVTVAGAVGMPTTGISAVQLTVTAVTPTSQGAVNVQPTGSTPANVTCLVYGGTISGTTSSTTISAVGADGKIQVKADSSVNLLLDVQGYYTSGDSVAAGGYVPITPARLGDTRNGTGVPLAKLAAASTTSIQMNGRGGIPADASAVFATLSPFSTSAAGGYLVAYPSDAPKPTATLNFPGNVTSNIGAVIPVGADGKINLYSTENMDFVLDVVGYFTATPGDTGAFTPGATRVLDTRQAPNTAVPANTTVTKPLAGIKGVPLAGAGISAVAISMTTIHNGAAGWVKVWPGDRSEPGGGNSVNFPASTSSTYRSDLIVVRPGADGSIKIKNFSNDVTHVVMDVVGWYSNVTPAIQSGQTVTGRYSTLQAGSVGGAWVTYQYRVGTIGAFADVPVGHVTTPGTASHPASWPVPRSSTSGKFDPYQWDLQATLGVVDKLVQVQACYRVTATDTDPVCGMPSTVQLGVSGFQNAYATTDVGPGKVAELTGDYQMSVSDVDESAALSALSVSRTLTTLAPLGERSSAAGVFGPGWTADLAAADGVGAADLAVVDQISDGYLIFRGVDGASSVYQATSAAGTYPASFAGVGDAAAGGWTISMPNATTITLTDLDGTVTTWSKSTGVWLAVSVAQTGSASSATYTYNSAGQPIRTIGSVPAGVNCASPASTPGCRSLEFSYTTVTVAGVARTRLAGVSLVAADPATQSMVSTAVASYTYDTAGRLVAAWDPRITPALKTTYSYTTQGRLAAMTPPGLATWSFGYDATGRLSSVSRPDPSGPTATSTVVYDVPVTGSTAPVELGAAAAAAWGQTENLAATGTAVFGPNHAPAGTTSSAVAAADWPWASIDYLDANGRTVNSAAYGANAWQIDATRYSALGNALWSLTADNRAQALQPTADTAGSVAALTTSAARSALLASTSTYDPLQPTNLLESFGPTHPVADVGDARNHVVTVYDEGAPTDGTSYNLPTRTVQSAQTPDGVDHGAITSRMGYDAVNTGDPTGWSLRQATTSTSQMGTDPSANDLTTTTRYDTAGRVIANSLPGSSGSDTRTRLTSYYTSTGSGVCVNPANIGLACQVGPAAQPATGAPVPVSKYSYNRLGQLTTTTDTSGATTRTSTTTFDAAGRVTGTSITTTGLTGSNPLPARTISYSATTGLPTSTTAGGQTLSSGYDNLGRTISYTDTSGNTATIGYDTSGRIVTANDGKGATSYSYDTSSEHRGLITTLDPGTPGGGAFTVGYDAAGRARGTTYPNGMIRNQRYDNAGQPTYLDWGAGSNYVFETAYDTAGRTAHTSGGTGDQQYRYDNAGRLIQVADTQPSTGTSAGCTTRAYTFSKSSNRTAMAAYPDGSGGTSTGGSCTTSSTPAATAATFDDADRITTTGYSYDNLGRTLTLPASDAVGAGTTATVTGALSAGYYDNDMAATLTQGGQTRSYTLDPSHDRIATIDDGTTQHLNVYTGPSDNPAWTLTQPAAAPARTPENTTWQRHIQGPDGLLGGTQNSTGTITWNITDPQGSTIATTPGTSTTPAPGSTWTEYGTPRNPDQAGTYGWLSNHQRSTDTLGGLTLMGIRLYNPTTGRFLTTDPLYGGNANAYVYPIDPVNNSDVDGRRSEQDAYSPEEQRVLDKRERFGSGRLTPGEKKTLKRAQAKAVKNAKYNKTRNVQRRQSNTVYKPVYKPPTRWYGRGFGGYSMGMSIGWGGGRGPLTR